MQRAYYQPMISRRRSWSPWSMVTHTFLDISNLGSLYEDRGGAAATTPASVNGVVGTVKDLSGNARHWTAPTDAARPVLRNSGLIYWLEFDNVDDRITGPTLAGLSTTASCFIGVERDGIAIIIHKESSSSPILGVIETSASRPDSGSGTPTYYVNGSSITATRTALQAAIAVNTPAVAEIRSFNASTLTIPEIGALTYAPFATYINTTKFFGSVFCTETEAAANAANIRTWVGNKCGLTI